MVENRLQEWFAETVPARMAGSTGAFVLCPCSIMMGFSPAQLSYVEEVYRMARELTEAQMRKPVRSRMPEFSMN